MHVLCVCCMDVCMSHNWMFFVAWRSFPCADACAYLVCVCVQRLGRVSLVGINMQAVMDSILVLFHLINSAMYRTWRTSACVCVCVCLCVC